jgi:hypothetical protein
VESGVRGIISDLPATSLTQSGETVLSWSAALFGDGHQSPTFSSPSARRVESDVGLPSLSRMETASPSGTAAVPCSRLGAGRAAALSQRDASFFSDYVAETLSSASAEDLADYARWSEMSGPVSGAPVPPPLPAGGTGIAAGLGVPLVPRRDA